MGVAASWNDNCQGVEESNKIKKNICKKKQFQKMDLNQWPQDFQSNTLTAELFWFNYFQNGFEPIKL